MVIHRRWRGQTGPRSHCCVELSAGCGFMPARSLSCRTVRHNRNAYVSLTLERRSVNVLTCEFAHQIRGGGSLHRVPWGEKEGGDEEPDRPGRPTQRERRSKPKNNPPDRDATRGASKQGTPPANTRPNLNDQREQQPRPQVEDNPTRTQPARQATHKPSPPPQKRTAPRRHPPSNRCPRPTEGRPEPGTTAHQAGGAGVKEGSKGSGPPHSAPPANQRPGPTNQTPPPTRHPDPRPRPQPETRNQNQDPHHPPTTPPPTPHQVPCTHAMEHIQPTPTLANKLEQNPETSSRKSEIQMPRPRPSSHPTYY